MLSKIIRTFVTILLVFFPIIGGNFIGSYSPYIEGNAMTQFLLIYTVLIAVIALGVLFITSRFPQYFIQPTRPAILLFFMGCIMLGIAALVAPPDISTNMLKHPEREHVRYLLLFLGAGLFCLYFLDLFLKERLPIQGKQKWLMMMLFALVLAEMVWEFSHHYAYPEALKAWIEKGNKAEDFSKHYDDWKLGTAACVGRFIVFILICWLSLLLYKAKKIRIWNPILNAVLGLFGIASTVMMFQYFNYGTPFPKGLEFLFFFFIPGIPFLLMYWIGVAMLTRKPATKW